MHNVHKCISITTVIVSFYCGKIGLEQSNSATNALFSAFKVNNVLGTHIYHTVLFS